MKHRRKGIDIFSLSFLDVISCGFGAVVMLILISKTDVDVSTAGSDDISSLLASLIGLENSVAEVSQQIEQELSTLEALSGEKQAIAQAESSLENQLKALQQKNAALEENISGLSLVESRLKQAALPPQGNLLISVPKKSAVFRSTAIMWCSLSTRQAV